MSDCFAEAESKENLNTSEEELVHDVDGESFEKDFHSQNILQDELPFKENAIEQTNTTQSPISSKRDTRIVTPSDSTDCKEIGEYVINTENTIANKNDQKRSERTPRVKSYKSSDCKDIDVAPTQIIPELPTTKDTMNEKAGKKNIYPPKTLIQSDSSTDLEDIALIVAQEIPQKKPNADDDVTNYVNTNFTTKVSSDSSDVESTSTKAQQFIVMDSDLTDSDEIKMILMSYPKPTDPTVTDLTSESEEETSSGNEFEKTKLIQILDLKNLPERVITRQRKPTFKLTGSSQDSKIFSASMFKPSYLTELEDQIDEDIILENIKRLRAYKKAKEEIKRIKDSKNHESVIEGQKGSIIRNKRGDKSNKTKGKMGIIIKNPKRKNTKSKTESFARESDESKINNNKKDSLDSTSASKPTNRRTRSKKYETRDSTSAFKRTNRRTRSKKYETRDSTSAFKRTNRRTGSKEYETRDSTSAFKRTNRRTRSNKYETRDSTSAFKRTNRRTRSKKHETRDSTSAFKRTNRRTRSKEYEILDSTSASKTTNRRSRSNKYETRDSTSAFKRTNRRTRSKKYETRDSTSAFKRTNKKTRSKEYEILDSTSAFKTTNKRTRSNKYETRDSTSAFKTTNKRIRSKKYEILDSTSAFKTTNRRTMSKKYETGRKYTEKKSVSPENNKKGTENKKQEKEIEPEIELRRSKRQQKSKEKNDDTMKTQKFILKKSIHDQSTVYNISPSSLQSPRCLKKSLIEDSDVPSPKRTRSHNTNNNNSINNASLRATPTNAYAIVKLEKLDLSLYRVKVKSVTLNRKRKKVTKCLPRRAYRRTARS